MQRYSRKRQSILDCLLSTKEHPTAEWIYSQIKPQYPSLSLATVYRNLNMLRDEGLIQSVGTVMGQERFDADVSPHTHIVCIKCGRVADAFDVVLPKDVCSDAEKASGFRILRAELRLSGICSRCESGEACQWTTQ